MPFQKSSSFTSQRNTFIPKQFSVKVFSCNLLKKLTFYPEKICVFKIPSTDNSAPRLKQEKKTPMPNERKRNDSKFRSHQPFAVLQNWMPLNALSDFKWCVLSFCLIRNTMALELSSLESHIWTSHQRNSGQKLQPWCEDNSSKENEGLGLYPSRLKPIATEHYTVSNGLQAVCLQDI